MKTKLLFMCFCIYFFQIQNSNAQWGLVGEDYAGGQQNQQLKVDGDDNVYLAYTESNNESKITVKKRNFSDGSWELVGTPGFSESDVYKLNLAIYNNIPYIAYTGGENGKLTVLRFDGTSWVTVGATGFTPNRANWSSLAIDTNGVPYVAFSDSDNGSRTTVMKYNALNTTWEVVGTAGFSPDREAAYHSLAIDSNNVVYVAYHSTALDYQSRKAYVSRFNGTSWEFVKTFTENNASPAQYTSDLSLAIDSNNKLLALSERGRNSVLAHNVDHWSYYGNNFGSDADQISLVIGNNNVLYQISRDGDANPFKGTTYVQYNDNQATPVWNLINPSLPNSTNDFSYYHQIAVDSNGTLYIAYQDGEFNKEKTSVYRLPTTAFGNWSNISPDNSTEFSFSEASSLKPVFDSNNTPYIAYRANNGNGGISVVRFDGTKWNTVGAEKFDNADSNLSFVLDKNNVPYVAFTYVDYSAGGGGEGPPRKNTKGKNQKNNNNYAKSNEGPEGEGPSGPPSEVKLLKFNGTNWVNVGSTIKIADGSSPVISFDSNNNLHVLYSDSNIENKTTLLKFNGSTFETVGTAGFSAPFTFAVNIAFDSADVPYVGTIVDFENYSVSKFNGTSFDQLGETFSFTKFSDENIILKFDANDVLYVSNINEASSGNGGGDEFEFKPSKNGKKGLSKLLKSSEVGKIALRKFDSVSEAWEDFSSTGLPSSYEQLTFDFDSNNLPYIAYAEDNNEVFVKNFNTTTSEWDLVGAANFTFGNTRQLNIIVDSNNIPYVIYTDGNKSWQPRIFSYLTNTSITNPSTTLAWNAPSTWGGIVPTKTSRVTIPAGKTVIIDDVTSAVAGSIIIEGTLEFNSSGTSSSTLITQTDPVGNIAFKRDVLGDQKWHIVAAPLTQNKDVFAANNALATGNGNNRGIGFYNDGNAGWTYYQDGATSSGVFNFGDAYSVLLSDASELQLEGSATASPVNKVLSRNTSGWNLVGNPYLAFLPINVTGNATNNILDNNEAIFATGFKSLYLWNNDTNDYTVVNQANTATTFVSPGQGFFINAKNNGDVFQIAPSMRSHENATFFKSSNNPFSIELEAKAGNIVKRSQVKYFKNTTTDLDEGYDAGQFSEVLSGAGSIRLFTQLVKDAANLDIDLALQVLPDSGFEEMIIPVGLEVKNEVSVTLKATITDLPTDYKVFLEDRKNNTFYQLDNTTQGYTVEVAQADKKGRFYLHTTTKNLAGVLSVENNNLLNVTVYVSEGNILQINGLDAKNAKLEIFNLLGKQVFTQDLQDTKESINLNRFAQGLYIVKLKSKEQKETTKKIILE